MSDPASHGGRPRSEQARVAVLHAVDDLLVEVGYAAMTMKGIAERAGVGRQTVYRWWSTKAEILFEASVIDARSELASGSRDSTLEDLTAYLEAVIRFLTQSPAGNAYRTLLGEAQHNATVADLLADSNVLEDSARPPLRRAQDRGDVDPAVSVDRLAILLLGPVFFQIISGRDRAQPSASDHAAAFLAATRSDGRSNSHGR